MKEQTKCPMGNAPRRVNFCSSSHKFSKKLFQRNLKKPLDKQHRICYNKFRKKRTKLLKTRKENKMTTKNFYNAIASNESLSAELREFAANAIVKMDKESASRNSKAAEKRAAENAPFVEAVTNLLKSNCKVWTAAEVKDAIEGIESTSKATAILKMVEGIKVSEVAVNRRIVKGYSL